GSVSLMMVDCLGRCSCRVFCRSAHKSPPDSERSSKTLTLFILAPVEFSVKKASRRDEVPSHRLCHLIRRKQRPKTLKGRICFAPGLTIPVPGRLSSAANWHA